jgi:hypothetical protein
MITEYTVDCLDKFKDFVFKTPVIHDLDLLTQELKDYVMPIVNSTTFSIDNAIALDFQELSQRCPRLFAYFRQNNLRCEVSKVLNIPSMTNGWIHADAGIYEIALNIGLENAANNWNVFYKITGLPESTSTTPGQGESWVYFKDGNINVEEIARYNLDTPKFFNVKIPHRVVNNTDSRRIVMTFRFLPDPDIDKIAYVE